MAATIIIFLPHLLTMHQFELNLFSSDARRWEMVGAPSHRARPPLPSNLSATSRAIQPNSRQQFQDGFIKARSCPAIQPVSCHRYQWCEEGCVQSRPAFAVPIKPDLLPPYHLTSQAIQPDSAINPRRLHQATVILIKPCPMLPSYRHERRLYFQFSHAVLGAVLCAGFGAWFSARFGA